MTATIKGMFFNDVLKYAVEKGGPEIKKEISLKLGKPLRYIDFFNYPVQELVLIHEEIVKKIFPEKTTKDGMFELGRESFKTFAKSRIGKAILPYLKKDFKGMSNRIPAWYKQMSNYGTVEVVDLGEKSYKLVYKDNRGYPEIDHGMLQQALDSTGHKGTVTMNVDRREKAGPGDIIIDFELIVEWE